MLRAFGFGLLAVAGLCFAGAERAQGEGSWVFPADKRSKAAALPKRYGYEHYFNPYLGPDAAPQFGFPPATYPKHWKRMQPGYYRFLHRGYTGANTWHWGYYRGW